VGVSAALYAAAACSCRAEPLRAAALAKHRQRRQAAAAAGGGRRAGLSRRACSRQRLRADSGSDADSLPSAAGLPRPASAAG
jgi:hypothetical protein